MCNPPVQILLAENDRDTYILITTLIAQIPGNRYQLEVLIHADLLLSSLVGRSHDIYLIGQSIVQQVGWDHLRQKIQDAPFSAVIVLADVSKLEPLKSEPSNLQSLVACSQTTLDQLRSEGVIFLDPSNLTAAQLATVLQLIQQQAELQNKLDAAMQDNQQLILKIQTLNQQQERHQLAFQGMSDGIWDWNLETNEIAFSIEWQRMLGYPEVETRCHFQVWFERIHPEDLYWVKQSLTSHLEGNRSYFESEHRILHQDGKYRWMLTRGQAIRNEAGQATRIVGIQTNVSALKQTGERLAQDALYDSLTGLPNRVSLMECLRRAGDLAIRNPEFLFAVLFIDLDRFKTINDSLGHEIGDQLLTEISARLTKCLRSQDTIARLSGDEFVIVLEDIQCQNSAIEITQQLLQELAVPFCIEGRDIFTSASIGIAFSSTGFIHPENLLRDADLAMYRAKNEGRGRYAIFHPRMHSSAVAQLELETDLRRAIERHELRLYYQPIVSLRTSRLVGFEALVRWQHPKQGLISPDKFIPIAEETGLILPIGNWILREGCVQMRRWQQQFPDCPPLTVNINLSSHQLTPQLVSLMQEILIETGLEAHFLKLEITESVLMSHAESAIATLSQLKQLGVQLAIDDFGTGYSSLSYLHRLPIDTLKVDRSFIQRVDVDGEQLAIVRTIITLAWNLGMEVVAEGVETPKQLAQLRLLQCEYAQGYLFSKPCNVETIETMLSHKLEKGQLNPFDSKRV